MYGFLKQPRWIAVTLLLPFIVWVCWIASQWQYHRHLTRSAVVAQVEATAAKAPVPLDTVVGPDQSVSASATYTRVNVTGVFDESGQRLVRLRRQEGATGLWVVTPMRTATGTVAVVRGWVPPGPTATAVVTAPAPPAGEVTITGRVEPSEPDRPESNLPTGQTMTVSPSAWGWPAPVLDGYVVQTSEPVPAGMVLLEDPNPGLGPHLAYSGQWLAFAVLAVGAYVYFLLRTAREQRSRVAESADDESPVT